MLFITKGGKVVVEAKKIKAFIKLLNVNRIQYVLIKNDDNVLPNSLKKGEDIDFLVHPSDYDRLIDIAVVNGYEKIVGESCKRYFLYQLREDILLKKDDCFFHFFEALSCNPLTNMGNCKMPMETIVQEYLWSNRVWDSDNNWWIMDDIMILLYLIVRSVFDKMRFRDKYVREIEKRIIYIDGKEFYTLARTVFWGFTPRMIEMIKKKEYERILGGYLSYMNY